MVAIAAAVLVTFIGGLYFITHHKKEESETLQSQKVTGNGLPPKPEERWRYIKELESRQPGVRAPTEPSAGGEVKTPEQLTPEQRQLLEQMQADMRQQPLPFPIGAPFAINVDAKELKRAFFPRAEFA